MININPPMKDILGKYTGRVAIYPGSFDPFHVGHWDIYKKAVRLFDKVIVAKGINPEKDREHFALPTFLKGDCVTYNCLVTELFTDYLVPPIMIRGLRGEYDLAYEENLRKTIQDINPEIQFVYLFCETKLEHVSSSMIRGLLKFNEKEARKYLMEDLQWEKSI